MIAMSLGCVDSATAFVGVDEVKLWKMDDRRSKRSQVLSDEEKKR